MKLLDEIQTLEDGTELVEEREVYNRAKPRIVFDLDEFALLIKKKGFLNLDASYLPHDEYDIHDFIAGAFDSSILGVRGAVFAFENTLEKEEDWMVACLSDTHPITQ